MPHDLFKLAVATMEKNVSYDDKPDVVKLEHCHIYHTIDSSGKPQNTSTAVGGHFHMVEVIAGDGGVPTLKVGPPVKWVKKRVRGVMKKIMQPIFLESASVDDDGRPDNAERHKDTHTHEVLYLGSEEITLRKPNIEAGKVTAAIAQREATIAGIRAGSV